MLSGSYDCTRGHFVILVSDGPQDRNYAGVGRILLVDDLELDKHLLNRMSTSHNVMYSTAALKPVLLRRLLTEGCAAAVYIDLDIHFYRPIDDLFEQAAVDGVVLSPLALELYPRDGKLSSEPDIMRCGIFNSGLVEVGFPGALFLDFWFERLSVNHIDDRANGLFGEPKRLD